MDRFANFMLPSASSTFAGANDKVFGLINLISIFFLVLNVGIMLYFVMRYRRRRHDESTPNITHNNALEIFWTAVPTLLLVVMFVAGYARYMDMRVAPFDAEPIYITGQRWSWTFEYPAGVITGETMVVPVGRPVKLIMKSQDVLHSFFIPDFRIKQDVLPNRYTTQWFEATEIGEYPIYCTEYCGDNHSTMLATVSVRSEQDYQDWLATGGLPEDATPAEKGAILYKQRACNTCHSLDGTRIQGPSFKGIWGHDQALASGETVLVDENYVRESIINPGAKIAAGYAPVMPSYAGQLKDEEITWLIEFLKTIE